jgi:outer membrane protein OmpA-like peptidoglycan-associated protein
MRKSQMIIMIMLLVVAAPLAGQARVGTASEAIANAEIQLDAAATAGARTHAPALYEEASTKLESAKRALADRKEGDAHLHALQSIEAAKAAQSEARWRATHGEIRTLRSDIERFGATPPPLRITEEPALGLTLRDNSRERVRQAREITDLARAMRPSGAELRELERAETMLDGAERIVSVARNNRTADHMAYSAEMVARRVIYDTQLRDHSDIVTDLQRRRNELAQAQATQTEVENLRNQLRRQQEVLTAELSSARLARIESEQRLAALRGEYEAALRGAEPRQIDELRRRIETQESRLDEMRREERQSEEALLREIESLRRELSDERARGAIPDAEIAVQERQLLERSREIERLREERLQADELRRRTEEEFRLRIAAAERQSEALTQELSEERAARQAAERELEAARAAAAERERIARERQAEIERMRGELSELAETRTDARGFIVTLPGLFFDTGRSDLKPGTRTNLTRIAELLGRMDRVRLIVEGHTDSVGSDAVNQRLSEARARAVRDRLVSQGVDATVITTVGRGPTQPIATNDTREGRAQNRRVEIIIEEL